jgi:tetratricopeptide (TPR) repeat protein
MRTKEKGMTLSFTRWFGLTVLALAMVVGCGPATVQTLPEDLNNTPKLSEAEKQQLKEQEEEAARRKKLAESLKVRQVVVAETPEFVPGVEVEAQKSFAGGVVNVYMLPPDYSGAANAFEQAVTQDKNFLEAYFNLGMVYERTGEEEKALTIYQKALDANPESGSARAYIGKVYLAKAREAFEQGDVATADDLERKAKDLFDQVIVKTPDNVEANNALALYWLMKAQRESDKGKKLDLVATAEDFVQNVLTVQPSNVIALNTRGLIYLLKEDLKIARWIFENKVLTLDKFSTEAFNNLGLTYYKLGDTPKAMVNFHKAIQTNPENLEARLNLAAVLLNYLNYEAAREQYEYVLAMRPEHIEATIGLGSSKVGMQEFEDGFDLYRKAVDMDKGRIGLLDRIGRIYQMKLVDFENAMKAYQEYIDKATPLGIDVSKAQASLEQSRKMAEQMKKMEVEMAKAEEEAKKMEELMAKKGKELEKRMKIVESKANDYRKKLETLAADNAEKAKKDKAQRKTNKAALKLAEELGAVELPFKEAREYIQMTMVDEAEPMVKAGEDALLALEPRAVEILGIEKVQKLDEEGGMPAGTETPKAEEPKAEEPKAEEPKAEEPKAEAPKAEEPKAEEPKAEEPKAEEPKAEEPAP